MKSGPAAVIGAETLLAIDLFRELTADERCAIAKRCRARRFAPRDRIVSQLDERKDVFFIVSGNVRVTYFSRSGKAIQFRDEHAGQAFGELSAIDGRPRSADVVAVDEVFAGVIDGEAFLDIATHYPKVAKKVFSGLAAIVRSLSDRIVELSTLGVSNRIHAEILRLAKRGDITANVAEICPSPTHADIASRVSTHREAVTKELGVLTRSGIVERDHGMLRVLDVARLAEMVEKVFDD